MQGWAAEKGSLWALENGGEPPAACPARIDVRFGEFGLADAGEVAGVMGLEAPALVRQRLQSGRRCFGLWAGSGIVAYGWVTRGSESVGELERDFNLPGDEAYIWDCGTVTEWRGRRCYSALLSRIVAQLHQEGVVRTWIGASRQNQPSIRGFANAGFGWVLDLSYRRLHRLTMMRLYRAPTARPSLLAAAYRLLLSPHERRIGSLIVGYRRP